MKETGNQNSPVTVRHISDYSEEDRARWNNIKPVRNSEGKKVRKPIVTDFMTGRNTK